MTQSGGANPVGKPFGILHGMRQAHFTILGLVLLLYLVDGIDNQLLAVTVADLARTWGRPLSDFGTAMAAGHAGSAVGAVLGGLLADRFGRRPVIVVGALLFGGLTFLMTVAQSPAELVAMRFVAGLGLGGCMPPGMALLAETMPPRFRGTAIALAILCAPLGIASAGIMGSLLLGGGEWQSVYYVAGTLTSAVVLALIALLPESPAHLARRPELSDDLDRTLGKLGIDRTSIMATGKAARVGDALWLLCGRDRARTIGVSTIFFLSYLAMTMVLAWLPALMAKAGFGASVAGTSLSLWSFTGMAGIILCGIATSRLAIRRVVASAMLASSLALAFIGLAFPATGGGSSLGGLAWLLGIGGLTMNANMSAIYAYAVAAFPARVRGTGMGLAVTSGRIGAIAGSFAGIHVIELASVGGFFLSIAAIMAITLIVFALLRSEDAEAGPGE